MEYPHGLGVVRDFLIRSQNPLPKRPKRSTSKLRTSSLVKITVREQKDK